MASPGAEDFNDAATSNPLDTIEDIAQSFDWPIERFGDEEIETRVGGRWTDYQMSLNWREDLEALHLACGFEMRIPPARLTEVHALLADINEHLWFGHFDLWGDEDMVLYRHGLPLHGGAIATVEQLQGVMMVAVETCERFFPAFQFVVWAGKSSKEAMAASLFETEGEA